MRRWTSTLRAACALLFVTLLASCAQMTTKPSTPIDLGALKATRSGDHGKPLVFIPGLSSGPWAWQPMTERFAKDHVVYVVTLAGFDGMPPAGPKPLAAAEAAIVRLIEQQKIDRPVLVGHSLGGTMAIHIAQTRSDLIAGVVALDGLPVFPRSEDLPLDQRPAYAARVKASLPRDPAVYAASQNAYMASPGGVIDPVVGKRLAGLSGRSDPASVASYLEDALAADFRPGLPRIKVPVLLLVPYRLDDYANNPQAFSETDKGNYYAGLMRGTPKLQVVTVSPARHFAMFDQPDKVEDAIRAFLGTVGPR